MKGFAAGARHVPLHIRTAFWGRFRLAAYSGLRLDLGTVGLRTHRVKPQSYVERGGGVSVNFKTMTSSTGCWRRV